MKNSKLKKVIIFSAILFIALIVLIIYFQRKSTSTLPPIAVTNSVPSENASGVSVFDPVMVTFNQAVSSSSILVASEPSESWTTAQSGPNTIRIDHKLYLRVSTAYTLTILQNGNIIGILKFETAHDQNDPRLLQNLKSQLNTNYPLAALTPFVTSDYRIVYTAPLTLGIELLSSIKAEDAISQVKLWVKSNNIDPETHKYIITHSSTTHP